MDTHIKEKARKIRETTSGEICNHCLGRKFSKELEGPGNPLRGVQIREIMSLGGDEFSSPGKCSICGGLFQKLEKTAEKVENKINKLDLEYSSFLVGSKVDPDVIKKDENLNQTLEVEVESIKREINRELGKILEDRLQREVDFDNPQLVINADFSAEEPKIHVQINPLFLEGRYRKLIRGIPQTKWPCRKCRGMGCESCKFTGKMYLETVEELISEPVLKLSKGKDSKFHGAGREDIDVKMLGSGRPFVLEIKEPRRRVLDLEKLEKEINETTKGKVDGADKIRTREVMEIKWEIIDPKTIKLIIKGQGGLYIKELISGDDERTQPNVSQVLGTSARCVELDVLEVGI